MDISRDRLFEATQLALSRSRAVILAGPRQRGKSTLAASLLPRDGLHWFDLENPVDVQRLQQPMTLLTALRAAAPVKHPGGSCTT